MRQKTNTYLIAAILFGLTFHGSTIFFTLESTYDALIHLFFANHYANSWFEPWNFKWYTGFTVMSYPPLVHQSIGALSLIGGLKFGLFSVAFIAITLFITGAYRFALLITGNRAVAGYSVLFASLSSSFIETLHIFGQLPSIVGISVLMHALPEIYLCLSSGKYKYFFTSLSLISVTVTSHHVTPIFGMVFFILPLIGTVIMDKSRNKVNSYKEVTFKLFLTVFFKQLKRNISFGFSALFLIVFCIFPYWLNSKNNPITQVPIPHGSRDNFLEITSSGLVFFFIPWGVMLLVLPYIFYRYFSKRYLFFGLSIAMLTLLGTGGTTPLPKLILGDNAFNILTLDRFTLWASIMSLPIMGEFIYRIVHSDLKTLIVNKLGAVYHKLFTGFLATLCLSMVVFTMSLGYFRPSQPQKIKMLPIVNFLNQDQHDKWRFLTLGFGDQMAWLSAQTNAMTVDGNYHSARRLPELTTRPIERLENSKFQGVAGIGSLQQFLTTPEKYNLKYIFSNDKFYDPILFFCGWQRLPPLENGIMVWEKLNVPPLSSILPKDDVSRILKIMWGVIPFLTVIIAFILNVQSIFLQSLKLKPFVPKEFQKLKINYTKFSKNLLIVIHIWICIVSIFFVYGLYLFYLKNDAQRTPENAILAYYDAIDFKEFEKSYQLLNPENKSSIAQFMLEISVTDGILNSYGKLDAIRTEVIKQTPTFSAVKVITQWITPLEKIEKIIYKELTKVDGKWYLEPTKLPQDLPPDQLYTKNITKYFNQGRRRVTTEDTFHEDVLKQPVLEILKAKLIKRNGSYSIVGEIQNIDNVPADVVIKGTLYNDANKELATYNAKYHIKHKLVPKEVTSFRIDFEGIAWSKTKDSIPKKFNPDEFTPVELEEQPTKFNIQAAGNVSKLDLYKDATINKLKISKNIITGSVFNSGLQQITVPQLLVSYYNENKELLWVDHFFVKDAVRQERKQHFKYPILQNDTIQVINTNTENCFVNGLPNNDIANSIEFKRIEKHSFNYLQQINTKNYKYIKIELNNFIGSPN